MAKKNIIPEIMNHFYECKIFKVIHLQLYEKVEDNLYQAVKKGNEQKRIRAHLQPNIATNVSTSELKELYQQFLTDQRFEESEENLNHPYFMRVENGIVDVREAKLIEDNKNVFLYCNSFKYVEDARWQQCPEFSKMLEKSGIIDVSKELLMEVLGYILSECQGAKVAFFFIGPPDCGKSVLLNFISEIIGEDNVTAMPLNKLGARFNIARLASARANICTELSGGKMENVDIFKAITSNEKVTGEHKCEAAFEFTVTTKLLFAGNLLPKFPELEGAEALMNRMVILRFPKSVKEKDLDLSEKLLKERDIICSLAVKALKGLIARRLAFAEPEAAKSLKDEMRGEINLFQDFINENCEICSDGKVHFVTIWNAFQKFSEENGCELSISKQQFSQRIGMIEGVKHSRFRLNGSDPLRGYEGIRMKKKILC